MAEDGYDLSDSNARRSRASENNSWAHQTREPPNATHAERDSPRPTNRDRYENKPMPTLPSEPPDPNLESYRRPYIQPTVSVVDLTLQPRNRATTDPAGPSGAKTLFGGRRPSMTHLRKRFGHSKNTSIDERQQQSSAIPFPVGKAAQVLGVASEKMPGRMALASPGLADDHIADEDQRREEDFGVQLEAENSNQAASTEAGWHTREHSQDTVCANPKPSRSIGVASVHEAGDITSPSPQAHQLSTLETKRLAPPKVANFGKIGDKGFVQDPGLFRIESVQGIIEHAESSVNSHVGVDHHGNNYEGEHMHLAKKVTLPSISCVPSSYNGIWENDPAVGYSLPPFSPMSQNRRGGNHTSTGMQLSKGISAPPTPSVYDDHPAYEEQINAASQASTTTRSLVEGIIPLSSFTSPQIDQSTNHQGFGINNFRPYLGSANSWATSSKEGSFTFDNGLPSAILPPRWPDHHMTNAVPSPPHTRQDYERPGSLAAGLSRMDMTIHHHLNTAFGSLSRQIEEKHDKVLDRVLGRLDSIEDDITKSFKTMKGEIKAVGTEIGKMKATVINLSSGSEIMAETLRSLENKMEALDKVMETDHQQLLHEFKKESERQRQHMASRDESPMTSDGAQPQQQGLGRTASRVRLGKTSNKNNRSNISRSQQAGGTSDDRENGAEPHVDMRALPGPPDIRNHPAYAGIPQPQMQMYDQHGVPVGTNYPPVLPYGSQHFGDDIQPKRQRPSAVWKRVECEKIIQTPTTSEVDAICRDQNVSSFVPSVALPREVSSESANDLAAPPQLQSQVTMSVGAEGGKHVAASRSKSKQTLEIKSNAGRDAKVCTGRVGRQEPRRLHLTRVSDKDAPRLTPKHAKHRIDRLAVFVEKLERRHGATDASRVLEMLGESVQHENESGNERVGRSAHRKRPAMKATKVAREEGVRSHAFDMTKTFCDGKFKKLPNQWDIGSEELARYLQTVALEESALRPNEEHPSPGKPILKFPPKRPPPRKDTAKRQGDAIARESPIENENNTIKLDECDFVFDTYVKADPPEMKDRPQSSAELFLTEIDMDKVGILIIEDEEEVLWEAFGEVDDSDAEWDSEQDDENGLTSLPKSQIMSRLSIFLAESYFGNDYPDEEVKSDDMDAWSRKNYRLDSDDEDSDDNRVLYSDDDIA
ncbi:uncharacterized protein KY384_003197 [Bacidia gigantensis]|uniref:uncharacterized protein n=1 Tax=Bacidia gigantensis TaxID=2732470 RepID=UPI001D03AFFB|nr:uncharacterized protein KY384_003197 [Bacidia gigantensis]KAG8531567.1 hypothetical protein KY384_003197 [Bacidia gigantensis]